MSGSGSHPNDNSEFPNTRVGRLLRERELRRSRTPDGNRGFELSDGNFFAPPNQEHIFEGTRPTTNEGSERLIKQRLLVVANRLPLTAVRKSEDSWSLKISPGGLVSALLGVKNVEAKWIGWPGVNVDDEIGQKVLTEALAEKGCIPVYLDEETFDLYYNGYSNNILWPLLHYLGIPQEDRLATSRSFQSQFEAYKKTNKMFADVINKHYQPGDIVWCHDYHLMFLPKYLKENNPNMIVGWFLHSPFPSSEIYRTLPSRTELLYAVLAADLVGFHTYDDARHFVSACTRILGLEGTPEGVEDHGRRTRVSVFPIGIGSERFIHALNLPQVQEQIEELKKQFSGRKVILGVDRLDMIKGIPQKILAFENFLEENPEWRDKVVLLQIAIPTRTDIPEYKKLKDQVHEIVGRINGKFGTLTAVPIHHLDRSIDFHTLCALYAISDILFVTSLRDGMNLVSYEFVACQGSKKGVLILSEFAGAAQSLGAGAILVNPWNITELTAAISQALNMPTEEREKRHQHNFKHVTTHTAQRWAELFVSDLNDTVIEAQQRITKVPPQLIVGDAVNSYLQANNRLLILGFNVALTKPYDVPGRRRDQIKEMELKLHPDLKGPLSILSSDPKTTIVVLSGSDRSVLDDNFGEYDMWLAAENGMFLCSTKGEWMTTMPEHLNMDWVDNAKKVIEYFTERTPRSHFKQRETSLLWNYKYTDVEFGRSQARDMLQHLWSGPISNSSVDVIQGSHSVEVRAVGVTKGAAIHRILGEIVHSKAISSPIDYVLCIGHFLGKDEDIYTFFEPEIPPHEMGMSRSKTTDATKNSNYFKYQHVSNNMEKSTADGSEGSSESSSWNVLDLKKENYFSCAVGRTNTNARYILNSPDEVVTFLKEMAASSTPNSSSELPHSEY